MTLNAKTLPVPPDLCHWLVLKFADRPTNRVMQRIRRPVRIPLQTPRRRGLTTPAVAIALLVIMMGLALIVDRIWLETAKLELRTAAEAAALAAAAELASDGMLQANMTVDLLMSNARQSAAWIAEQNYVGGIPVNLNIEPEGDIRFGFLYQDTMGIRFQESTVNPTTVVVTALRTRANNNPIALFIAGATGLPFGDVAARVGSDCQQRRCRTATVHRNRRSPRCRSRFGKSIPRENDPTPGTHRSRPPRAPINIRSTPKQTRSLLRTPTEFPKWSFIRA